MKRAVRIGLGIVLVTLVAGSIAVWLSARQVNREIIRIVQDGVSGPLEKPTQAALSYQPFMRLKATVSKVGPAVAVRGEIVNTGSKAIRQFSVHIRILDGADGVVTWAQGPVIRTIRDERGVFIGQGSTHILGNAYSSAEAPFLPNQRITFLKEFPFVRAAVADLKADLTVMEIEFTKN